MENEDYIQLEKFVADTINQSVAQKSFSFDNFLYQMEENFTRLGFRENLESKSGVESILLVRLDNIGDFLCTVPAIREVRKNYPNAYITLVVRSHVYPIAELCPYVNEVLPFDKILRTGDLLEFVVHATDFSRRYLWKRNYDLSFAFRYWEDGWHLMAMFLLYMSGATQRVAYLIDAIRTYTNNLLPKEQNLSYALLTHPILNPKEIIHDCARSLYLLKALGLTIQQTDIEFWYSRDDLRQAKKLLGDFAPNRLKVAVGLGATHLARRYPIEKYLAALRDILKKGAAIILLGGPTELEGAKFLEENLRSKFVKNIAQFQPNWRVTSGIISLTDMYLGNDTGTQHIAAALKKPIVMLTRIAEDRKKVFPDEPTELEIYYPWQTPSIIVQPKHQLGDCATTPHYSGCDVKAPHCITQIKPKDIVAAYEEMANFIKNSAIKKIACPPIIRSIDQVTPLKAGFEFKN